MLNLVGKSKLNEILLAVSCSGNYIRLLVCALIFIIYNHLGKLKCLLFDYTII